MLCAPPEGAVAALPISQRLYRHERCAARGRLAGAAVLILRAAQRLEALELGSDAGAPRSRRLRLRARAKHDVGRGLRQHPAQELDLEVDHLPIHAFSVSAAGERRAKDM